MSDREIDYGPDTPQDNGAHALTLGNSRLPHRMMGRTQKVEWRLGDQNPGRLRNGSELEVHNCKWLTRESKEQSELSHTGTPCLNSGQEIIWHYLRYRRPQI